jgi:hypothetical protein
MIWTNDNPCGAGSEGVTTGTSLDSVLVALLDATTVSVELLKRNAVEEAIVTSVVLVEDPVESIFDVVVAVSGVDDATCASAGLIIKSPVRLRPTARAKPTLGLIPLFIPASYHGLYLCMTLSPCIN